MKRILLFILIFSIFSCNKKEVQVPKVTLQGEEEVANYSVIWMFFGENGKLDLNEKNRISSTNWFFNIDKKLTLKEMLPEVVRLRVKHSEKSPHNTKPMGNYYSYINKTNDHLSFYAFDSIQYEFVDRLPHVGMDTLLLEIKNKHFEIPKMNKKNTLQLVYNSDLKFQEYMEVKGQLAKKTNVKNISRIEFIID